MTASNWEHYILQLAICESQKQKKSKKQGCQNRNQHVHLRSDHPDILALGSRPCWLVGKNLKQVHGQAEVFFSTNIHRGRLFLQPFTHLFNTTWWKCCFLQCLEALQEALVWTSEVFQRKKALEVDVGVLGAYVELMLGRVVVSMFQFYYCCEDILEFKPVKWAGAKTASH